MELRTAATFLRVAELQSFSKAAEKLYLTQPALSIAVRKVERSIGMPLFDRSCKPLALPPAGEIYLETIKKMLLLEKEQQQNK